MVVENVSEAVIEVCKLIEKNTQSKVARIIGSHQQRHRVILTQNGLRYYLMFKRAFFFKFGEKFNMKGAGESINESCLLETLKDGTAAIIISYTSGNVYCVSPGEWLAFSKANNTIRKQISCEVTHSIPLAIMRRWK